MDAASWSHQVHARSNGRADVPCSGAAPHGTSCGLCCHLAIFGISGTSSRDCAQQSQSTIICASRCAFFFALSLLISGSGSLAMPVSQPKQAMCDTHWPWTHGECGHTPRSLDYSHPTQLPYSASDWEHLGTLAHRCYVAHLATVWNSLASTAMQPLCARRKQSEKCSMLT